MLEVQTGHEVPDHERVPLGTVSVLFGVKYWQGKVSQQMESLWWIFSEIPGA